MTSSKVVVMLSIMIIAMVTVGSMASATRDEKPIMRTKNPRRTLLGVQVMSLAYDALKRGGGAVCRGNSCLPKPSNPYTKIPCDPSKFKC